MHILYVASVPSITTPLSSSNDIFSISLPDTFVYSSLSNKQSTSISSVKFVNSTALTLFILIIKLEHPFSPELTVNKLSSI